MLAVPNLAEAEAFYRELFDLDALFREGTNDGTFGALPEALDCEYEEKSDAVFVADRYGVEWELNASSPPPGTPLETLDV